MVPEHLSLSIINADDALLYIIFDFNTIKQDHVHAWRNVSERVSMLSFKFLRVYVCICGELARYVRGADL